MATNEQILERLDKIESDLRTRIAEVELKAEHNDEAIRGNGEAGLKARVAANEKAIARMEKYSQAVLLLVVGEIVVRLIGLVTIP